MEGKHLNGIHPLKIICDLKVGFQKSLAKERDVTLKLWTICPKGC